MFRKNRLQDVQDSLFKINRFVDKYSNLGDAHMVDYFVHDHWNTIVACETKNDILQLSLEELHSISSSLCSPSNDTENAIRQHRKSSGLHEFLSAVKECQEHFFKILTDPSDVAESFKLLHECISCSAMKIESKEYMCAKKAHEVAQMAPIVHQLCQHCETNAVLDIGSGKGYLSTFLTLQYNLSVTGVEANKDNSTGADLRAKKYLNYWLKHSSNAELRKDKSFVKERESKFNSVSTFLNHQTDLTALTESDKIVVTGLHACGDLSCNIISLFSSHRRYIGLCVVGCCYHHNTEASEIEEDTFCGFPMSSCMRKRGTTLGRTKRMLALQAPRKADSQAGGDFTASERSLFYRAVLNVIMKEALMLDVDSQEFHVGKVFAKSKGFADYVRRSLRKLKIDSNHSLSDEVILKYFQTYEPRFKELVAFTVLRRLYAPAIEYLIVLDRYCYLLEASAEANISHCFISELFDPVLSPRRFAIIASKSKS